jgi:hypothetical protein
MHTVYGIRCKVFVCLQVILISKKENHENHASAHLNESFIYYITILLYTLLNKFKNGTLDFSPLYGIPHGSHLFLTGTLYSDSTN